MEDRNGRVLMNINELAEATGLHRQTVSARLTGLIPAEGSNAKLKKYDVAEAFPAIYRPLSGGSILPPSKMEPSDRKAWYQSENERVKLVSSLRQLVPAEAAREQMRILAEIMSGVIKHWPTEAAARRNLTALQLDEMNKLVTELLSIISATDG